MLKLKCNEHKESCTFPLQSSVSSFVSHYATPELRVNGCRVFGTLDLMGEGVEMASVNYAFTQASIKELMDAYYKKIITVQS
jgi:hypothetical protein